MTGRIPERIIEEVNERSNIVDIVGSYVNLSQKGARWWGLCPFHNEKTPSFSVNNDSNLFYCFGCQKGGNVIKFIMEIESISFPESIRKLALKAGVVIPEFEEDGSSGHKKAFSELYTRVAGTFEWLLWNHKEAKRARDYLEERGISHQTAQTYQIGWAPDDGRWLYDFLTKKSYSPEFLASSGLFSKDSPHWSFFVDRLMFPIMHSSGQVIAFSGRALNTKGPKYKNSPETDLYTKRNTLYGLWQSRQSIRKSNQVYVCEGNLDVLACHQAGVNEVVAPLGTAFTDAQAKKIKQYCQTIIFMFDGDQAGWNATMKAGVIAEKTGFIVKAVPMPEGQDPADLLKKSPQTLKNIAFCPINIFEYLLNCFLDAHTIQSGETQIQALDMLKPYLNAVDSAVKRDNYIKQFAEAFHIHPSAVKKDIQKGYERIQAEHRVEKTSEYKADFQPIGNELYLMITIAVKPGYFANLKTILDPELMRDKEALYLYRILEDLSVKNRELRTDTIVDRLEGTRLANIVLQKAITDEFEQNIEQSIRECVDRIQIRSLEDERSELVSIIASETQRDEKKTTERLTRIKEIDQEIIRIRQGNDVKH